MPYENGVRISNEEWIAKHGNTGQFATGPNGENPAEPPEIDPEVGAPVGKPKAKRSTRSTKKAKAAIADAMGVKDDSPTLDSIDVSGLDAAPEDSNDGE